MQVCEYDVNGCHIQTSTSHVSICRCVNMTWTGVTSRRQHHLFLCTGVCTWHERVWHPDVNITCFYLQVCESGVNGCDIQTSTSLVSIYRCENLAWTGVTSRRQHHLFLFTGVRIWRERVWHPDVNITCFYLQVCESDVNVCDIQTSTSLVSIYRCVNMTLTGVTSRRQRHLFLFADVWIWRERVSHPDVNITCFYLQVCESDVNGCHIQTSTWLVSICRCVNLTWTGVTSRRQQITLHASPFTSIKTQFYGTLALLFTLGTLSTHTTHSKHNKAVNIYSHQHVKAVFSLPIIERYVQYNWLWQLTCQP